MVTADCNITITAQGEKLVIAPNLIGASEEQIAFLEQPDENESAYRSLSESRLALFAFLNESQESVAKSEKGRYLIQQAREWLEAHPVTKVTLGDDVYADKRQSVDEALQHIRTETTEKSNGHHDLDELDDDIESFMERTNIQAQDDLEELD